MNNLAFKNVWLILILVNLGIMMGLSPYFSPFEDSDSVDYIEASRHLKMGQGLTRYVSNIETAEIELKPIKLFPAGYPIMIYGLSLLGIDTITAAIIIPRLCFIILPFLLFYVFRFIGGDLFAFFVTTATVLMKTTIYYSFLAMSDVPFLSMTLLSFLLLFKAIGKINHFEGSLCYGLFSGLAAGFALAIRNVGYSIPLAVGAGLTLAVVLRIISCKFYYRTLISYGIGFILGYGPFLMRNLIVFHSWQPYNMKPSELSIFENIRYYFLAIEESFVKSLGDYTWLTFALITALMGISIFVLFWTKQINLIRNKYSHNMIGAFILIFYVIFGSSIVILGRTKYQWVGEIINPRHLLQYNWVFLAGIGGVIALFFQIISRYVKCNFTPYAIVGLIIILLPQWETLSNRIKYAEERASYGMSHINYIINYLQELPKDTYLMSTWWPALRIYSDKPIKELHEDISPEYLVTKVCTRRPLLVILNRNYVKKEKFIFWQDAVSGKIPAGFQLTVNHLDFMILFHPEFKKPR